MRKMILVGLALGWMLAGGCHVGLMGIYGCTGEQRHKGVPISCPRCGNSQKVDRLRVYGFIDPLSPLATHDWYCQGCEAWWRTRGWNHYQRGPGWPWGSER